MDRLDAMATLIAAVDGGSLSAAARARGMPLATVSRKVSELEAQLRTQLLVRTSRRLALTEAGRAYVAACRRILDDVDDAERAASGEYRAPRGHLTITAPIMFGRLHVEPIVLEFLRAYPEITIRLVLVDQVVSLTGDHVDAAIRIGRLADSSMTATSLGSVTWVACASPHYLDARGTPQAPASLDQHDCVMFESQDSRNAWMFRCDGQALSFPIRPRFTVNTADAAIAAAVASGGITRVLSYQVSSPVADGKLRVILRDFEPEPIPVSIVHVRQPLLALKLRAFLDFASPRLKASLAPERKLKASPGRAP